MAAYQTEKQKLSTSIILQRFFIFIVLIPCITFTVMYCKRIAKARIAYISADAVITQVKGPEMHISSHKTNPHYTYTYRYTCTFTDENGIEKFGILSKTSSEENNEYYCDNTILIYYAPDFQSGDEVLDSIPQKPGRTATFGYFSYWIIELFLILSNLRKQLKYKRWYGSFVPWRVH